MEATKQDINPEEVVLEFVFYGLFNPKNFEPSWLFRNEIMHPREVKEVNEIRINEAEVFYSTDILSFNVTYDSMTIKTNSLLTYDSLLNIAKRIVNVLRSDLQPNFNFNIRYHYRNTNRNNVSKYMNKLIKEDFWEGIVDNASLQSASISKSVQQKEFSWHTDISISMCRRANSNNELIHIFFRNYLDIGQPGFKTKEKEKKPPTIAKFLRLDNELSNVMKRCNIIGNDLSKRYFAKYE